MGGYGSGRWGCHNKAYTVEQSHGFPISAALRYGGWIQWSVRGEPVGSIGYELHRDEMCEPTGATLRYTVTPREGEPRDYAYRVDLVTRRTAAGIVQRLWHCPASRGGTPCNRLVRTIYLPPGADYFACRHCHGLTYAKNQEHSKDEWQRLARRIERLDRELARMGQPRRARYW
jgi:hypothetical protein